MSLGLPQHLVPAAVARSITNAFSVAALVHLAATAIATLFLQAASPELALWPALLPLTVLAVLMIRLMRTRITRNLVALLAVGVVCTYLIAATFHSQPSAVERLDGYIIAMPTLALMLAPGVAARIGRTTAASVAAFFGGCLAVGLSAVQHGVVLVPAVVPFGALALITMLGVAAGRGSSLASARRNLQRAQRDEQLASMRSGIELKAAALMHDTVLNDLASLAAAPVGPLDSAHRAQVERDLALLLGEEWLSEEPEGDQQDARAEWQRSRLASAIEAARSSGLHVDSTGDLTAVSRLSRESAKALGLAVRQCLANVLEHSGTNHAEVAVYGTDAEVTVMVVDAGRGFSESETAGDRMGLRHSVRSRVEEAGGSVRLWSTPGKGTSVMIRVPAEAPTLPRVNRNVQGGQVVTP
jgi:two-component sensor histidine kinase